MGNRPKVKQYSPVNGIPLALQRVEWSDLPTARYASQALEWMAQHVGDIGKMNVWQCEGCGEKILCIDRHPGVTPSNVLHASFGSKTCAGMCKSHFYNQAEAQELYLFRPERYTHEWYRPSINELTKNGSAEAYKHVLRGGLMVRPV